MPRRLLLLSALVAGTFVLSGCYSLSQPVPEPAVVKRPLPFPFEKLNLPNDCFIEAVRFHDAYCAKVPEGKERWVKLFQFGSKVDDTTTGTGHSVAVYQWKNRLCYYDTNQGVVELPVPPKQREDADALAPHLYRHYRYLNPLGHLLLTDVWQLKKPGRHGAPEAVDSEVYRQASRVADELAAVRATRVMRFSFLKDGKRVESAAAVFTFEGKICLYVPELGTMLGHAPMVAGVDNFGLIYRKLTNAYGPAVKLELILPAKL